jgi:hypothetical protein
MATASSPSAHPRSVERWPAAVVVRVSAHGGGGAGGGAVDGCAGGTGRATTAGCRGSGSGGDGDAIDEPFAGLMAPTVRSRLPDVRRAVEGSGDVPVVGTHRAASRETPPGVAVVSVATENDSAASSCRSSLVCWTDSSSRKPTSPDPPAETSTNAPISRAATSPTPRARCRGRARPSKPRKGPRPEPADPATVPLAAAYPALRHARSVFVFGGGSATSGHPCSPALGSVVERQSRSSTGFAAAPADEIASRCGGRRHQVTGSLRSDSHVRRVSCFAARPGPTKAQFVIEWEWFPERTSGSRRSGSVSRDRSNPSDDSRSRARRVTPLRARSNVHGKRRGVRGLGDECRRRSGT